MSSVTIGTDRPRSKLVTRKSEIILTGKKQSIIVAKKVRNLLKHKRWHDFYYVGWQYS